MLKKEKYIFDEFFLSGLNPSISPFLTDSSRKWCRYLGFKSSIFSLILFIVSAFFTKNISYILLSLIYFLLGIPAILKSLAEIKKLNININVLMTFAAFISIGIGKPHEGALLLILFGLSGAMEETITYKTKSALHSLNKIAPTKAFFIEKNGPIHEKAIQEIKLNDLILIKSGEIVPLDGIVVEGSSFINLKHLNGESLPISVKIGDTVHAGSKNHEGIFTLKVTKTSSNSTLNQIIQLISKAQKTKPKLQKSFDKFGKIYASSIILSCVLFAIFLPLIFSINYLGINGSIYRSLAFLIAASPCALIIATPTAYWSAISACSKRGIILKGGAVFDAIKRCNLIAFDKTGTLTKGELKCENISALDEKKFDKNEIITIAASLEKGATHPIANAISKLAENKKLLPIKNFKSISGYGVEAKINDLYAFLGSLEFIEKKITEEEKKLLLKQRETAYEKGQILTALYINKRIFLLKFSDVLRQNAKSIINSLKKKFKIYILTGDRKNIAQKIAKDLNVQNVFAELKPDDKLNLIVSLSKNKNLIMVGDGINDAPALTRANVGISMGKIGSATAIDASDVILLNDDLTSISWLLKKTLSLKKITLQNLCLSFLVIIGASVPALLGFIPLWVAVSLHEGSTFIVGLNSLRLLKQFKNKPL